MPDYLEYWIGKNIDYSDLWRAYEEGAAYSEKYFSMKVFLIRIEFENPPKNVPLFNHEAVFKTLKGYFHDLKLKCYDADTYNRVGPLFLYSVDRGSGIWEFLGELRQLLLYGTTLSDEKLMGQVVDNADKKVAFLRKNFGDHIDPDDLRRFMDAKNSKEINYALQKLYEQKISSVKISTKPFTGDIVDTRSSLVELKEPRDKRMK